MEFPNNNYIQLLSNCFCLAFWILFFYSYKKFFSSIQTCVSALKEKFKKKKIKEKYNKFSLVIKKFNQDKHFIYIKSLLTNI